MSLKIEQVPVDEISPYEGNAKKHPERQIDQIRQSIEEFGFNDPIAVWKNNEVIEGHGRLLAAKAMGLKKVPVIRLDGLTDAQRRAYGLVHNKLTLDSGFDQKALEAEIEALESIDMDAYGFELEAPDIDSYYGDERERTNKAYNRAPNNPSAYRSGHNANENRLHVVHIQTKYKFSRRQGQQDCKIKYALCEGRAGRFYTDRERI